MDKDRLCEKYTGHEIGQKSHDYQMEIRRRMEAAERDAGQLAAFLIADRAAGETTWKSPPISAGSRIARLIEKYEGPLA